MSTRVFVAGDPDSRRRFSQAVLAAGFEPVEAVDTSAAVDRLRADPCAVALVALSSGPDCGPGLIRRLSSVAPETCVIAVLSGAQQGTDVSLVTPALEQGAYDVVIDVAGDTSLLAASVRRAMDRVRLAIHNRDLLAQLRRQSDQLDGLNGQLADLASRDALTGLFNRRCLRDSLETEVARARRHGRPISVLCADVDRFRRYNELHGHLAGDDALRTLAGLLQQRSRSSTVAARLEGDRFILVAPETPRSGALRYAESIRGVVERFPFVSGDVQPAGRITVSIGVATFPEDGHEAGVLLERAVEALRPAIRDGGNRVAAWSASAVDAGGLSGVS